MAEGKDLLRFVACGSVDDGKSTLIGCLLHDSKTVPDDQLEALRSDSKKYGTRGGEIDYALLLDGLAAEREQAITIDVAYRHFSTARRRFIVADAPGHEQYTRNMVTGASTAEAAVVLVDAQKGLVTQTRRHSHLLKLLGIETVVVAVNKMDLVGHSRDLFFGIESAYREFAAKIGLAHVSCIPVSAIHGENVVARSPKTPWYKGPTLLECLESIPIGNALADQPFRMPVQWVSRPDGAFRGFSGTIAGGSVKPGDAVRVQPSDRESRVARIVTAGGDLALGVANQSIMLTLENEIDVSRGDVISQAASPAPVADQFEATVIWMSRSPLLPGRDYLLKIGTRTVNATVAPLKYKINVDSFEQVAARKLDLNEIGVAQVELDQPIAFEPYAANRDLGGFILIDRVSNETVGAGLLHFALRRSENVHWQAIEIDKAARSALKHQKPCVLWFTGLSGAGKSTIANLVEKKLHALGRHTYLLDGDNIRHGLNKDLGFTEAARVENIRRVAEVAALMADAGLIVLAAFISPFRNERRMARRLVKAGEFIEIFVDTPLAVAEARDPKGLYGKARRGELKNFTGIDSPYERPEAPEIALDNAHGTAEEAAERVLEELGRRGILRRD